MSIPLALHDAATNCQRDGATAIITLKSGVQHHGALKKENVNLHVEGATVQLHTGPPANGWITVVVDEIASVESRR